MGIEDIVVLGLIFLKYISDVFEKRRIWREMEFGDPKIEWNVSELQARHRTFEDRDEYQSVKVFRVPKEVRWSALQENTKQPTILKKAGIPCTEVSA